MPLPIEMKLKKNMIGQNGRRGRVLIKEFIPRGFPFNLFVAPPLSDNAITCVE